MHAAQFSCSDRFFNGTTIRQENVIHSRKWKGTELNCHAQTKLSREGSSVVSANLSANLSKYFSNNYQRLLFSCVIALVSAASW